MEPTGPNAEQIKYWTEQSGPTWVAGQEALDRSLVAFGTAAMDALPIATGQRVVDVGCGCGGTSIELADRVGEAGRVLGIDISEPMLARARERASGRRNLTFLNADAQIHPFPPGSADVLFSRFGVMFFADPTAAFANLRTALASSGRLAFICWQPLQRNPWMAVPMMAVAQLVTLPPPPGPDAPGPFAFADADKVRRILTGAGFADVSLAALECDMRVGGTDRLEDAIGFLMKLGPAAAALKGVEGDTIARVRAAIGTAIEPYHGPSGVHLAAATWIVTARRG